VAEPHRAPGAPTCPTCSNGGGANHLALHAFDVAITGNRATLFGVKLLVAGSLSVALAWVPFCFFDSRVPAAALALSDGLEGVMKLRA